MYLRVINLIFFYFVLSLYFNAYAQQHKLPISKDEIKLTFSPIVNSTAPAVVNIYTRRLVRQTRPSLFNDPFFRRFFGEDLNDLMGLPRSRIQNSLGSGVIVRSDGILVTNNHVISGSDEITVVLSDRREFEASILGTDERTDLAVLKIENPPEDLPALELNYDDRLEVGDLVLAIGNPFGVGQTVTSGIISALARSNIGVSDFRSFIQTDAAINPGNSGGALVGIDGSLVGINTAIYSRDGGSVGIGFAIPVAMVRIVVDSILSHGRAIRGWLGASGQTVSSEFAEALGFKRPMGVIINKVYNDSPADDSGIRIGDVLVTIDGYEIADNDNLRYRLATLPIGKRVNIQVFRNSSRQDLIIKLVEPPEIPSRNQTLIQDSLPPFGGATVANLNPALSEELGIELDDGVIVLEIKRRSYARQVGLSPGDFIIEINGEQISNVFQLDSVLKRRANNWVFKLKRNGKIIQRSIRL